MLSFARQNHLLVYGDGDGNIVIEEAECLESVPFAVVKIPIDRFKMLMNNFELLEHEAYHGSEENDDEA